MQEFYSTSSTFKRPGILVLLLNSGTSFWPFERDIRWLICLIQRARNLSVEEAVNQQVTFTCWREPDSRAQNMLPRPQDRLFPIGAVIADSGRESFEEYDCVVIKTLLSSRETVVACAVLAVRSNRWRPSAPGAASPDSPFRAATPTSPAERFAWPWRTKNTARASLRRMHRETVFPAKSAGKSSPSIQDLAQASQQAAETSARLFSWA
jgi:hypothetical protein